MTKDIHSLRNQVIKLLVSQGFEVKDNKILLPENYDKRHLRRLHKIAVQHKRQRAKKYLERYEKNFLNWIADGNEICIKNIHPQLIEVSSYTFEEKLFRYITLHWSIPVSSGYGRRLRFLILDRFNGKVIGVLGLGDPVFGLKARDEWIGWDVPTRKSRLKYVMDAFVLGAIPPYSYLLFGKFVALIVASREVRECFIKKYAGRPSFIKNEIHSGHLALITTSSAFGRSSLYNRITYKGQKVYYRLGFTRGSGEFHFSNGIYHSLFELVQKNSKPTAKQKKWGTGYRNRREVVQKALKILGLKADMLYHGVQREVYAVPLAQNSISFLNGEAQELKYYNWSISELFDWFKERWLLKRAQWDTKYKKFKRDEYSLWMNERKYG